LAQAAEALSFFPGVTASEATARRPTAGAGAAYEAVQTAAVEALEEEWPAAPSGPRVQRLSVDGAMVPLRHHEWAEGKTLAMGTVTSPVRERGEGVVHPQERSSFSRLPEAETFGRVALVETPRRGTATAKTGCAVSDGAEWSQGFVDLHRPEAVRLVAFPPALTAVAQAGQAVLGEETEAFTPWFPTPRQRLYHGDPEGGLRARRRVAATATRRRAAAAATTVRERLGDVAKRRSRLDDAWFQACGYPIGSGRVESANQLVVERRRKGGGRHWARAPVKPLVARRAMACSDRWQEAWPQIAPYGQHQARERRWQPQRARRQAKAPAPAPLPPSAPPAARTPAPAQVARPAPRRARPPRPTACPGATGPYRPPADHPWRRFRLSWQRSQHTNTATVATR
jgi:hypothetical protein